MDNYAETLRALVATWGIKLVYALAIYLIGRWVALFLTGVTGKLMTRARVDATLVGFTRNIVYAALLVFVVLAALAELGIQTTSFIAVLGAAGLAVGLSLQHSLANFAAGVMMILFRPFKVGDYIEAGGTAGTVEEIMIFSTRLQTADNREIHVPNGAITGGNIVNYSAKPTRRIDLVIGVGYGDDLKRVRAVLEELLAAETRILQDPAWSIAVLELGESSVNFAVRPWVNAADYWAVRCDLIEAVKTRFDAEGISIPYPQRDVHVHEAKVQAA